MFAANYNRVDAMKALLAAGANINVTTNVVDLASLTKPGFGGGGVRAAVRAVRPRADKPRRRPGRGRGAPAPGGPVRRLLPRRQGPGRGGPGGPGGPAAAPAQAAARARVRVAAVAAVFGGARSAVPISPASRVSSASTSSSPRRAD